MGISLSRTNRSIEACLHLVLVALGSDTKEPKHGINAGTKWSQIEDELMCAAVLCLQALDRITRERKHKINVEMEHVQHEDDALSMDHGAHAVAVL